MKLEKFRLQFTFIYKLFALIVLFFHLKYWRIRKEYPLKQIEKDTLKPISFTTILSNLSLFGKKLLLVHGPNVQEVE